MSSVRSIDLERLPEIRAALSEWILATARDLLLEEAYLYGSFAQGRPHEGSDIDLVLIGPFQGKLHHRIARILGTTDLPIQPLCYTHDEWKTMIAAGNSLAVEVLRTGKRLIGT